MKKFLLGLFVLICISCTENGVKLGKPTTFVRYFNGGTPDVAQSIIKTSDGGYLILANTQTALTSTYYRIKLTKVDAYGNEVWKSLLPDVVDPKVYPDSTAANWRGFGITAIIDNSGTLPKDVGYFIVGDQIYDDPNNNKARTQGLLMIQVEPDKGTLVKSATLTYENAKINAQVQGVGVTVAKNGNYYVVGQAIPSRTNPTLTEDMLLTEIDAKTFSPVWVRTYGSASTSLVNKLFTYGDSIYWGGTRTSGTQQQMAWIGTQINTVSKSYDLYPSGQVIFDGAPVSFNCNDICNYGFGYGFVGSYSIAPGIYSKIAFFRIDDKGRQVDSVSYPLSFPQSSPYQTGNSICSTHDGGFLILGTTSVDISTSDTNYLLIKTDAHGVEQWRKQYGGKYIDVGAKVLQADDGGYIILGTTTLANVQSIFLMKTDSEGAIE